MDVKAKLGILRGLLLGRAIRALEENLQPGESVLAVTTGTDDGRTGLLAATDRRLIWSCPSGAGVQIQFVRYDDVTGVGLTTGDLKATARIDTRARSLVLERVIRKEWADVADEIERRRA